MDFDVSAGDPHILTTGLERIRLANVQTVGVVPGGTEWLRLAGNVVCRPRRDTVDYRNGTLVQPGPQAVDVNDHGEWMAVAVEAPSGLCGSGAVQVIGTWEILGKSGAFANLDGNVQLLTRLLELAVEAIVALQTGGMAYGKGKRSCRGDRQALHGRTGNQRSRGRAAGRGRHRQVRSWAARQGLAAVLRLSSDLTERGAVGRQVRRRNPLSLNVPRQRSVEQQGGGRSGQRRCHLDSVAALRSQPEESVDPSVKPGER